nr:MAG TPA: hypothetical protein [Caudoviricetes sp.]
MSNPTRQEIIDAHEALDTLCERVVESTPVYALRTYILAALPPRPRPTMAEVEWDDDKHYLAEAEHPEYGKVAMLSMSSLSGEVFTLFKEDGVIYTPCVLPKNLTPTGRRYTLTEVQE